MPHERPQRRPVLKQNHTWHAGSASGLQRKSDPRINLHLLMSHTRPARLVPKSQPRRDSPHAPAACVESPPQCADFVRRDIYAVSTVGGGPKHTHTGAEPHAWAARD